MIAAQQLRPTRLAPSLALAPYISAYCHYVFPEALRGQSIFFLPEGIVELIVQLDTATQHSTPLVEDWQVRPSHFVGGLHTSAYLMRIKQAGQAWGVRFRPGAFAHFTHLPVDQLKNLLVAPADIWSDSATEWIEQLQMSSDRQEQWQMTERFLRSQLRLQQYAFPTTAIMEHISRDNGQCRVNELAATACLSMAQFRLRFKQYFGVSPKVFLRLYRLQFARRKFAQELSLTDLAYRSGYFDQAHFNHDVRQITGLRPSQLFPLLG